MTTSRLPSGCTTTQLTSLRSNPALLLLGLMFIAAAEVALAGNCEIDLIEPASFVPSRDRTPGIVGHRVMQANITSTICVPGWTATVRPSSSYTRELKAQQMRAFHLSGKASEYEEDHLVPLCIGGHPTKPRNLWPQPRRGQWSAKIKDQLENSVCRAVCRGAMTLEEGQAIFLRPNWTKEYEKFFELQ